MKPPLFSPRKLFLVSLFVILALTVIGWGAWLLSAAQYRRVLDGWIQEGRAAGYQIDYRDRECFGFPLRVTVRLVGLHWKNNDGIDFRTDEMDIAAVPWNWHDFTVGFKNNVTLSAPTDSDGRALTLASGGGAAHVTLDDDGFWRVARLDLRDSKLGLAPSYVFQARKLALAVARPVTPPASYKETGLTIDGSAQDIILPEAMPAPFGAHADQIATHMRVMGPVPDVRRRASVDGWNKDSGIVEFDDFTIKWGALDIDAKGTLGFDDDLQPEGAFAATVVNADKTMRVLIDKGFIAMHDQTMLDAAMQMFAQPLPQGARGMQLPITVQLGGLFMGPIRIFTFPQIVWPTEPPPI